jgi:hypothetical protein
MKTRTKFVVAVLLWATAAVAGMRMVLNYEYTPGVVAAGPHGWPAHTRLVRDPLRPTLVLFVHPHCPCTEATLAELAELMTNCQGKLAAQVIFWDPYGADAAWDKTDLWREAGRIPGATAVHDQGGIEVTQFQATISGQALLYDRAGLLLFNGGITASRGHAGDNDGVDAIVSLVRNGTAKVAHTAVFGCSLIDKRPPLERTSSSSD